MKNKIRQSTFDGSYFIFIDKIDGDYFYYILGPTSKAFDSNSELSKKYGCKVYGFSRNLFEDLKHFEFVKLSDKEFKWLKLLYI